MWKGNSDYMRQLSEYESRSLRSDWLYLPWWRGKLLIYHGDFPCSSGLLNIGPSFSSQTESLLKTDNGTRDKGAGQCLLLWKLSLWEKALCRVLSGRWHCWIWITKGELVKMNNRSRALFAWGQVSFQWYNMGRFTYFFHCWPCFVVFIGAQRSWKQVEEWT